uniref:Dehydrodolichyl diphosphate synthase 2-like n=1 Tax=Ananas comosus var. bracteatus TaxID=296719 RepID=A0A6V7NGM7_ANACO|nr:unnamed protein product [Ananas comosus var. bracteatus]
MVYPNSPLLLASHTEHLSSSQPTRRRVRVRVWRPASSKTSAWDKERRGAAAADGLSSEALPRHVVVIMDGNARWVRARGLPVSAGHEAGYRSLKQMVKLSRRWGI